MDNETAENYEMQRNLQREGIEGQNAMYAPQMAEQIQQTQAVLIEQTNPKRVVDEIMMVLKGEEMNEKGESVQVGQPKMNQEGLSNIWTWCRGAINQGIILSHYEDLEIKSMMNVLQEDLVDDLSLNWKKYGIRNKTDLDLINNIVLLNINAALRRALGQNEKNWLGKISIENISGASRPIQGKKDSFWSKFRL